jgi:flagellar biosynthesis protein FlhF
MFVKTYEADSLDVAFKEIKNELGPDAIILKTVTNKGVKGVLKKKKYEITAAIKERDYIKKGQVDRVMNKEQKEKFYTAPAKVINQMIDNYDSANKNSSQSSQGNFENKKGSYADLGLNRSVKSLKDQEQSGFHDFLKTHDEGKNQRIQSQIKQELQNHQEKNLQAESYQKRPEEIREKNVEADVDPSLYYRQLEKKIRQLEEKMDHLKPQLKVDSKGNENPALLFHEYVKSLGFSPVVLEKITAPEKMKTQDFKEWLMKELYEHIKTSAPLIMQESFSHKTQIELFISGHNVGKTQLLTKLKKLGKNYKIISFGKNDLHGDQKSKLFQFFKIENLRCQNLSELMGLIRNLSEEKDQLVIDYSINGHNENEVKYHIDSLKNSFEQVEVLWVLNAIHSNLYNRSILNKYSGVMDGLCYTFLDKALNFSEIINHNIEYSLPLKLFSTGEIIPDDIELATSERLIKQLFNL